MDAAKNTVAPVTAGRALYDELLAEYQQQEHYAGRSMTDAAVRFADSNKDEDRTAYLVARARHQATIAAKDVLTRRAGAMVYLVKAPA